MLYWRRRVGYRRRVRIKGASPQRVAP